MARLWCKVRRISKDIRCEHSALRLRKKGCSLWVTIREIARPKAKSSMLYFRYGLGLTTQGLAPHMAALVNNRGKHGDIRESPPLTEIVGKWNSETALHNVPQFCASRNEARMGRKYSRNSIHWSSQTQLWRFPHQVFSSRWFTCLCLNGLSEYISGILT